MSLLHAFLRDATQRVPERDVHVARGRHTSYGTLDLLSGRFAGALRAIGVLPGDRVGLVLEGDLDYLVSFYGILKAGAAVMPLVPDTRTQPLVSALAKSEARAVIMDQKNARYLRGQESFLPYLRAVILRGGPLEAAHELEFEKLAAHNQSLDDAGVGADDLAMLQFTSGTTGEPKGVMLAHRNLVANARSIVESLKLGDGECAAMALPYYYSYGNSVLQSHVAVGGCIAEVGSLAFVPEFLKAVAANRCTGFAGVPSMLARLCDFSAFGEYELSNLRYITSAGAAMPAAMAEKLRQRLPKIELVVMYGQSEASARLAYVPPEKLDQKLGSAGKAIPGVTLQIMDTDGRPLAPGTVGEVVASGPNVMLGYWRDPEATARVLRPEGLRTGDIAKLDEEGFLFIEGRASELIKTGAHRVSPLEIEAAIAHAPGVREVGVCGLPHALLGEQIAGFIVAEPGVALHKRAILDACFPLLPKFKMPALLFQVDALPRTDNGKLARRQLIEWHAAGQGRAIG